MMKFKAIIILFVLFLYPSLHAQLIAAKYTVKSIKANTKYSDYGANFFGPNKVIFASNYKDAKKKLSRLNSVNVERESYNFDLYTGFLNNRGEINYVQPVKNNFTKKYNESNVSFTPDLKYVYFTQNNVNKKNRYVSGKNNWVNLKIYRARVQSNGQWTQIEELPFNSDNYSCAHPSLSEDGRILFFSSDMPGGFGKSDIYWVTVKNDGTFGKPQNLGEKVNSKYRESFPYIDGDVLYFSSDRPESKGGLDIFMVSLNSEIGKPTNLGAPINSQYDDFCFVIDRKHKRGFFSSNRPDGKGDDDIYYFKQETRIKKCENTINGYVFDRKTEKPVADADIYIFNSIGLLLQSLKTGEDGTFSYITDCGNSLKIRADKQFYISATKKLDEIHTSIDVKLPLDRKNPPVKPAKPLAKSDSIKPVQEPGNTLPEKEKPEPEEKEEKDEKLIITKNGKEILNVPPVFFELNSYHLRKDARSILNKVIIILRNHPEIRVEFAAHTDCRASKAYNLHLSQLRAKTVVQYITSAGISPDRIRGKGYGESQPVNKCVDGVPCTEKEHLQNRRAEFVILH